MLDAIKTFLNDLTGRPEPRALGADEQQLAAAALLFHVIAVDGIVSTDERRVLAAVLKRHFDLDDKETEALIAAAEEADKEAVDLYSFTSVLKRQAEEADREKIVEMMWRLVYADGAVHEFEDNVIWRVAELLGVDPKARIRLKQAARSGATQ
jgi:uncharacterized tellurite resistance protein B-like protein